MGFVRAIPFLLILTMAGPSQSAEAGRDSSKSDAERYLEFAASGVIGMVHREWTTGFDAVMAGGGLNVHTALIAPIRFDFDGTLRMEDWDELSDFGRIVLLFGYGGPRDDIAVRIEPLKAYDLGCGNLVSHFRSTIDPDHWRTGIVARLHWQPAGADLFMDSFLRPSVSGARVYVRPIWWADKDGAFGRFEIGASVVADWLVPVMDPIDTVNGQGLPDGDGRVMGAFSVDMKWPVVAASWLNIVPWAAWSLLDESSGWHVGLGLAFRPKKSIEFSITGEWRYLNAGFVAPYFDTLYMADRYQFFDQRPKLPSSDLTADRMGFSVGATLSVRPYLAIWAMLDWDEDGRYTQVRSGMDITFEKTFMFTAGVVSRGIESAEDMIYPDRLYFYSMADAVIWRYFSVFSSYARDLTTGDPDGLQRGMWVSSDTWLFGLRVGSGMNDGDFDQK